MGEIGDKGCRTTASRPRRKRRETFQFGVMGIRPKSQLHWKDDYKTTVTVLDDRLVTYNGVEMSLTKATEKVLLRSGRHYRDHPCPHWTYKRERLSDIYERTYRPSLSQ